MRIRTSEQVYRGTSCLVYELMVGTRCNVYDLQSPQGRCNISESNPGILSIM